MGPKLKDILKSFIDHVNDLSNTDENDQDGFTKEFQLLRDDAISARQCNLYPAEEGRLEVNIRKNRYKDILPYDETRVTLGNDEEAPGGDYINASFIKDVVGNYGYIAAQGPLPHTVDDFWAMLWAFDIEVIVMVCREVEKAKTKCERYWVKKSEEKTFKDIKVSLIEMCCINNYYCVRRMRVTRGSEERIVTQFHYTGWLDHDIPVDYSDIIDLITNMRESQNDTEKPIVVHCSAGCGRTGTICAVDFAWSKLRIGDMDGDFSMFDIIREMRTQRPSMVQTPDQYRVAHLAVAQFYQEHLKMMSRHDYENVALDKIQIKFPALTAKKNEQHQDTETSKAARAAPQSYENHVIMNQVEIDAVACPKTKDQRQVKRAIAMFNFSKEDKHVKATLTKTENETKSNESTNLVAQMGKGIAGRKGGCDAGGRGNGGDMSPGKDAPGTQSAGLRSSSETEGREVMVGSLGDKNGRKEDHKRSPVKSEEKTGTGKFQPGKISISPIFESKVDFPKVNKSPILLNAPSRITKDPQVREQDSPIDNVKSNKDRKSATQVDDESRGKYLINESKETCITSDSSSPTIGKVSQFISDFDSSTDTGTNHVTNSSKTSIALPNVSKKPENFPTSSQRSPNIVVAPLGWPPAKNVKSVHMKFGKPEETVETGASYDVYSSVSYDDDIKESIAFQGSGGRTSSRDTHDDTHVGEEVTATHKPKGHESKEEYSNGAIYATVAKKAGRFVISEDSDKELKSYNRIDFKDNSKASSAYVDHLQHADSPQDHQYHQIYSSVTNMSGDSSDSSSTYATVHSFTEPYDISYSYAPISDQIYSEANNHKHNVPTIPSKKTKESNIVEGDNSEPRPASEKDSQSAKKTKESHSESSLARFGIRMKNAMNVLPIRRGDHTVDMNLNEKVLFRNHNVSVEQVKQTKPSGPRPIPSSWRQVLM